MRHRTVVAVLAMFALSVSARSGRAAGLPEADALAKQGKCAEAVPLYQKAWKDTRDYAVRLGLVNCLIELQRFDEAMKEIEPGVTNKAYGPRFLIARARIHALKHELRDAGIDIAKARELAPKDPDVLKAGGDFYRERGTWALAIPEYRAALAVDPNRVDVETALAEALFNNRQSDEALRTFRQAAAHDPNYAPAQLGLGDLLMRSRTADPAFTAEARTVLRRYVQLAPSDPRGWALLARAEYQGGARDSALAALEHAHQLGDTTSEASLGIARGVPQQPPSGTAQTANDAQLGHQLEVAGRLDAADSVYRALLARDSTSTQAAFAWAQRARLLYRKKQYRQALPLYDRALAIDPRDADAHFYRGITLKELGRTSDALAAIRKSTELDPKNGEHFFWLGALEEQQKKRSAAVEAYEKSIALEPSGDLAAKANRQLGFNRLLGRQWKAALPYLRRSVELDPKDVQAWLWLAQGSQNAGDRKAAADGYRHVLELDPQNGQAKKGLRSLGPTASTAAPASNQD